MTRVALLMVAGMVVASACHGPQVSRYLPYTSETFTLDGGAIKVELTWAVAVKGPKPAVIGNFGTRRTLADAGAVVVSIDYKPPKDEPPAPEPGEGAAGSWMLRADSPAVIGRGYLKSVDAHAEALVRVVDLVSTHPQVDPERIAVVGSSTQGFAALQAASRDHRIDTAVILLGCGDYHAFLHESWLGMNGKPLALDPGYERWIDERDIVRHPERMLPVKVLLVSRTGDQTIPVSCVDATARALAPVYARAGFPERFEYIRRDVAGHGVEQAERIDALMWLYRWVLEKPDPVWDVPVGVVPGSQRFISYAPLSGATCSRHTRS
jgi:dienelactone hydrolase